MKFFILTLSLLAGFNAFASTLDGYSLPITGVQTEENFILNTIQTRTEYRNETIRKTCYRTVNDGYRTECVDEPRVVCFNDREGRPVCSTRYERICRNIPQYRQEAYTCYETVSIPYEVFSNNVKASVKVIVANVPGDISAPHNTCGIDFTLNGPSFTSVANCSEFIILAKNTNSEARFGDTVVQDRLVSLTLLDAKKVSAPTSAGISEMRLEDQTLVLKTGNLEINSNFSLKLFVERRKFLKGDETIINRNLLPSEYTFEKINENSGLVKIKLDSLIGGINAKKKHVLKVDIKVNQDVSGAINKNMPALSASESITVNN
jgi:hypothetical protein